MRRQVKFVGNCQASALANFYRTHVGNPREQDVVFVDDLGLSEQQLRDAVRGADIAVVQRRDFNQGLTREQLGASVQLFQFPLVMAGFLWPFANEPHVRNVGERPISDGPYPSQMGDSFLNRLIAKGVPAQDALQQYLELDIARVASLDRMAEIYIDRQRERDRLTDMAIADLIQDNFASERLFLTAEHPGARLFRHLAGQLFERMAVPAAVIDTALATVFRSPFPPTELPLHPGVIAHFGLPFANASDTRYTFADEGRFTFAEYVLRYMNYDNNPQLRRSIYMAGREDPATTLPGLEAALERSPASAVGWRVRGRLLDRLGRYDEAVDSLARSIAAAPDDPDGPSELAYSLLHAGRADEAAAHAGAAVALAPTYSRAQLALAEIYLYSDQADRAVEPAKAALRLAPGDAQVCRCLGIAFSVIGRLDAAEEHARRGMLMDPQAPDHRNLVAEIIERRGRRDEAIALLRQGRATGCANDQSFSLLGNFLQREGDLAGAEEAFAYGSEHFGAWRPDLTACLEAVRRLRGSTA